jgi:hypothetical protein
MSKHRILRLTATSIAICWSAFCLSIHPALAQEAADSKAKSAESALTAFRLDFALSESEDGKKINTRHYSMNLVPGYTPSNEVKIGSRVPVEAKPGEVQYIDIGTNIWSRMTERGDAIQLEVRADLSNLANPEQEGRTAVPVVRQVKISASTIAEAGKPTVLGVVDDPNSKRQFQLDVTVTRLK